ncbi:tRNA pseudouridine synthase B [Pediococcus stilesii]|uniref:tRNA pseudouridine synthase B n=2 Tax=Pediococcus stilesii TaxID=331679 RepID=A0A0R2L0K2_9LACO|nr:tRNA pseudouridine synthase B [Pediococcus stilesii]
MDWKGVYNAKDGEVYLMNGIIPINKERGMTSHDVVAKVRGILKTRKVGHSGTLDPNVDGVLPVCVGRATKVVDYLMDFGKTYKGSITLGFSTTTEDLDGDIVDQKKMTEPLSDDQINATLNSMTGTLIQIPPMYSAVKVNGRKLYEYARAGQTVERPERKINVYQFKQIKPTQFDPEKGQQTIFFEVKCGKGTYVRTLAVDFGLKFDLPAVMSDLTRLSSGGFGIDECLTLSELEDARDEGQLSDVIYPLDRALKNFNSVIITDAEWKVVQNGGFLKRPKTDLIISLKYKGNIQALYQYDEEYQLYKPKKMLLVK